MQTDSVFACYVEVGDFLVLNGEPWRVTAIEDTYEDHIFFELADDEGERINGKPYPPFAHVTVVTSFEESFSFEDVDIEA